MTDHRIDILICTFRRPAVTETLASLARITLPAGRSVRVIVADNDDTPSAEARIGRAAEDLPYPVLYLHAPARNISIARNACLDAADAGWVAFLDDDERVEEGWMRALLQCAQDSGADAVFGPVLADYDADAPDWIRRRDYHSSYPQRRGGRVETGLTGNALLRWHGMPWSEERFDLARGRSGGEDTEFYFRLNRAGARFEICETAIVHEAVPPERLNFRWLWRRKFRMGQSYVTSAPTRGARLKLAVTALAKAAACWAVALALSFTTERRNYWMLRGIFHGGVVAGCLSVRQAEHYGSTAL